MKSHSILLSLTFALLSGLFLSATAYAQRAVTRRVVVREVRGDGTVLERAVEVIEFIQEDAAADDPFGDDVPTSRPPDKKEPTKSAPAKETRRSLRSIPNWFNCTCATA